MENDYFLVAQIFLFGVIPLILAFSILKQFGGFGAFFRYLKGDDFDDAWPGIAIAVAATVGLVLSATLFASKVSAQEVSYFNYVEIDVGLLYTRGKPSAQCVPGELDQSTSDLRIRLNAARWQTPDGVIEVEVNADYVHHSCQFGRDRNSFDGLGPKGTFRWNF